MFGCNTCFVFYCISAVLRGSLLVLIVAVCLQCNKLIRIWIRTRLTSNLRSTTCVCVHLVTCRHFRSHDKDGDHTIQSAVAENPVQMYTTHPWPWPWPDYLHIRTWPVSRWDVPDVQIAKMNFVRRGFWKLWFNRHTDATKIIYHAALWVVNK